MIRTDAFSTGEFIMHRAILLLALTTSLIACAKPSIEIADGFTYGCGTSDSDAAPPDLTTAMPKCAAAKGLAGDNLLCVDFKDMQMLSSLSGWDFSCTGGALWSTTSGKLQVNSFSTFMDTCTAKLPAVSAADYQKYSSFTLSIVHKLDVNSLQQKALIMLGADDQDNRLLDWMTGKQPRKQWTQTVAKADLPLMAMGSFQPLLKISSNVQVGTANAGWQIESIAIQGLP